MPSLDEKLAPFIKRMQAEHLPEIAIKVFAHYYAKLLEGQTGLIPEASIRPAKDLPDMENAEVFSQELARTGRSALPRTVLVKLNGGLGTSMGLEQAKSLLIAKNDLSFLDITARQALQANLRLVLMNSFATRADSLAALKRYPRLWDDIPLDFLQHRVPKIIRADLSPAVWPQDPQLEWAPFGHGNIYTALASSGMLDTLLRAGYEYAFASNSDNLGAVVDATILGYLMENQIPFMMEVAERTEMDKKGGHLAQLANGQLVLRERAQCPPDEIPAFQDVTRHRYFNTNNLWIHLPTLKALLNAQDGILDLPVIRNAKFVDPKDNTSTPVYQLETAMGSAIALFENAQAIRVPRTRFIPVKTTNELLALRSDAYTLAEDYRIVPNPARQVKKGPIIELDPIYYKNIGDMEARFPQGIPSLVDCARLSIKGNVKFGRDVTLRGSVTLVRESGQYTIQDGTVIEEGKWRL